MKTTFSFPVEAVLLLGPTGAGKSPLGEHIVRSGLFGKKARRFDFGAELRAILSRNDSSQFYTSSEITFIKGVLEQGQLLENRNFPLAGKIIGSFLVRSGYSSDDVLVLNGIPRHIGQARDIAAIAAIHLLIILDCDAAALVDKKLRLFKERTAPLVDHYKNAGAAVFPVAMSRSTTAEDAYRQILMPAPGHPPVPFVAEPP